MSSLIKILVVDDHTMMRKGLVLTLKSHRKYKTCITEASSGIEVLKEIEKTNYDVILLDINMPEMDGIETLKKIKTTNCTSAVIMLTMHREEDIINKAIAAGASGYILKSADTKELFKAISNVLFEKDSYYSKEIKSIIHQKTNEKVKTKKKSKEPPPPLNINEVLSPKEIIILNLITKELTSDEIGQMLFISRRTVEGHRTRIMEKLKIKTMIGLVKIAIRNNLGN